MSRNVNFPGSMRFRGGIRHCPEVQGRTPAYPAMIVAPLPYRNPGEEVRGTSRRGGAPGHFVDVAAIDRLVPGKALLVSVAKTGVAVFNVDGRMFAIDDSCVRCASSLANGTL